ncbi:hypothetical protein [Streptomyces sp. C8S0]|uniref:hypothetical protein n=1 Tax=Streptomyces sp. C8S0 TaxID=2585716 RepID=UPI001D0558CD|nr:hypothetical protein [Streptomyces sp. C8S0]
MAASPHTHTATDEELIAEIAALDGTDARLLDNEDMRTLVLSALRADYRMLASYQGDSSTVACPSCPSPGTTTPSCRSMTRPRGRATPPARSTCTSSPVGTSTSTTTGPVWAR